MTLFEYMSVAISLIVALTFAEGLRGLQCALHPGQRYVIHVAWLFIKLSNPIIFWWFVWGYRDNPEYWNFATYSLALVVPSLVYLQMLSLVSHAPHKVSDWKKHFYVSHPRLLTLHPALLLDVVLPILIIVLSFWP